MHSITQTIAVENEISSITESFFSAFKLGSLLKQSGAYKAKGIPVLGIFRQLFELAFIHKKLFEALRAGGAVLAAKDTFYRFLNSVNINWTRFTLLLAERVVNGKLVSLTDEKRLNVFHRGRHSLRTKPFEERRASELGLRSFQESLRPGIPSADSRLE